MIGKPHEERLCCRFEEAKSAIRAYIRIVARDRLMNSVPVILCTCIGGVGIQPVIKSSYRLWREIIFTDHGSLVSIVVKYFRNIRYSWQKTVRIINCPALMRIYT